MEFPLYIVTWLSRLGVGTRYVADWISFLYICLIMPPPVAFAACEEHVFRRDFTAQKWLPVDQESKPSRVQFMRRDNSYFMRLIANEEVSSSMQMTHVILIFDQHCIKHTQQIRVINFAPPPPPQRNTHTHTED